MNENMNQEREFDFFDMIEALMKKWKAIVCLTLVAAIVAAALGFAFAFSSDDRYGTTIDFYIKSEKRG